MAKRATIVRSMALAAATLAVAGGTVLGAARVGTDGDDTLVGTHRADTFDGKSGNDLLKGMAGNDLYHFRPNSGQDTIQELKRYKVGDETLPGGTDTVSFADVTGSAVRIWLIPEWGRDYNRASRNEEYTVEFGASPIENATGTAVAFDELYGGSGANTLHPGKAGAGSHNWERLWDYGGWRDGALGRRGLPASNDRYVGVAENGGRVYVQDWGGAADVLDLRPLALTDVRVERVDVDGTAEELESLQVTKRDGSGVVVLGHYGEWWDHTTQSGQQGRIEKLVFADGGFDAAEATAAAETARGGVNAELADAAARLTAAAREDLKRGAEPAREPAPGASAADGDRAESTKRPDARSTTEEDGDERRDPRVEGDRDGGARAERQGLRDGGQPDDDGLDGKNRRR